MDKFQFTINRPEKVTWFTSHSLIESEGSLEDLNPEENVSSRSSFSKLQQNKRIPKSGIF